jgi:hypothetical protein
MSRRRLTKAGRARIRKLERARERRKMVALRTVYNSEFRSEGGLTGGLTNESSSRLYRPVDPPIHTGAFLE